MPVDKSKRFAPIEFERGRERCDGICVAPGYSTRLHFSPDPTPTLDISLTTPHYPQLLDIIPPPTPRSHTHFHWIPWPATHLSGSGESTPHFGFESPLPFPHSPTGFNALQAGLERPDERIRMFGVGQEPSVIDHDEVEVS